MSNLADPVADTATLLLRQPAPPSRARKRVQFAVRWIASACLVGWLAVDADWRAVSSALGSASLVWAAIAAMVYLGSQLASAARWRDLVRGAGLTRTYERLVAAYFEGLFVNTCLPTTLGGDALKVVRVGGSNDKKIVAGTVLADRASGLVALLGLLAIGVVWKLDDVRAPILGVIALAVVGAVVILRLSANALLRQVPQWIQQFASRTAWGRVFVWAFVVQVLNVVLVAAAARAVGVTVPATTVLIATTTVSLAATLPFSISGFGVREASLPILLSADGVPREAAIAVGLVWSAIVLTVGLTGGPVHFLEQRRARDSQGVVAPAARRAA